MINFFAVVVLYNTFVNDSITINNLKKIHSHIHILRLFSLMMVHPISVHNYVMNGLCKTLVLK